MTNPSELPPSCSASSESFSARRPETIAGTVTSNHHFGFKQGPVWSQHKATSTKQEPKKNDSWRDQTCGFDFQILYIGIELAWNSVTPALKGKGNAPAKSSSCVFFRLQETHNHHSLHRTPNISKLCHHFFYHNPKTAKIPGRDEGKCVIPGCAHAHTSLGLRTSNLRTENLRSNVSSFRVPVIQQLPFLPHLTSLIPTSEASLSVPERKRRCQKCAHPADPARLPGTRLQWRAILAKSNIYIYIFNNIIYLYNK